MVLRFDAASQQFEPFVPQAFEALNFNIDGGMGVVVNVMEEQEVTFTGTVWDNLSAAPAGNPTPNWAFAMVGQLDARIPAHDNIVAVNRNRGWIGQRHGDQYIIVAVDQDRQPVVGSGDRIEITVGRRRLRYQVTDKDLSQAFTQLHITPELFLPQQTRLLGQNYPNPFNPETWIPFELAHDAEVTITIYDMVGRQIRQLDLGHTLADRYRTANRAAYWDGKTEQGETVASGTYFYQIRAGDYTETRKMVILK